MSEIRDTEQFRDNIATVDKQGKRIWIYPKKPVGRFYQARTWVSFVLLALLFGMPFIKVNGDPLLLFNVIERKFILFSIVFTPQDLHLFALAMITFMVFIVLFTVVFGRLFCGWACPQTIFMEMVFRKIEYWIEGDANQQRKLDKAPWNGQKIWKKTLKHSIFFAFAIVIANTFLAYIIGIDEVIKIIVEPPSMHLTGFLSMLFFSGVFYFVFARMREQVCIAVCPYGRLQGVLLDENSIVVAYDTVRGEPRGKIRKSGKRGAGAAPMPLPSDIRSVSSLPNENVNLSAPNPLDQIAQEVKKGDCIDCTLCVQVCPTGIDIRHGTQLECVNCTACMDACDAVMDKIKRDRGLIRYDSHRGIYDKKHSLFNNRVKAYSIVLLLLVGLQVFLFSTRSTVEFLVQRTPGMLYQEVDNNHLSNLYNYQIINKTGHPLENFELRLKDQKNGIINPIGTIPLIPKQGQAEGAFFIEMPRSELKRKKTTIKVEIFHNDKLLDEVSVSFLGP